jgi:putative (di)nucleoside polyphosphate hydrolase
MNTWQMPQGGIDPMENPIIAALRELREETGITSVQLIATIDPWLDYEFPTKVRADIGSSTWVRYRGQTQKWLLLEFTGSDREVDLSCHGAPEFSEWRWMSLEDLPASVVDFKRGVYESVARHFCPRIATMVSRVR